MDKLKLKQFKWLKVMPVQNTQRSQHSNAAMTSIAEISWTLFAFSDQFDCFFLTSSECLLQQIMQLLRWPEYRKLMSSYSWDWWITVFWARAGEKSLSPLPAPTRAPSTPYLFSDVRHLATLMPNQLIGYPINGGITKSIARPSSLQVWPHD